MVLGSMTLGSAPISLWIAFHLLLLALLVLDAAVSRARPASTQPPKNASTWLTVLWIMAALLFALEIGHALHLHFAAEYLAAYGVEESLSIDNMFVFLLIFRAFGLTLTQQRRVLLWGVLGAVGLRACMIAAGLTLIHLFAWANFFFGIVLVVAAVRLLRKPIKNQEGAPRWTSWVARYLPLSESAGEDQFFIREQGRLRFTHLFLALVVIEVTDIFFAVDSIPAVLAVSHHPFVVYTSNIFAVVGLRSLYFVLATMIDRLHRLHYGLAAILAFMGAKMLLSHIYQISIGVSLGVLGGMMAVTLLLSWFPQSTLLKTPQG